MLKIVPLYDRVVIRRLTPAETTAGGKIVIPDNARDESLLGVVVEVGVGRNFDGPARILADQIDPADQEEVMSSWTIELMRHKPLLEKGDLVTFGKWSGTVIQLTAGGEPLFVMREDEVVGKFEGTQAELAQAIEDFEAGRSVLKLAMHNPPKAGGPVPVDPK